MRLKSDRSNLIQQGQLPASPQSNFSGRAICFMVFIAAVGFPCLVPVAVHTVSPWPSVLWQSGDSFFFFSFYFFSPSRQKDQAHFWCHMVWGRWTHEATLWVAIWLPPTFITAPPPPTTACLIGVEDQDSMIMPQDPCKNHVDHGASLEDQLFWVSHQLLWVPTCMFRGHITPESIIYQHYTDLVAMLIRAWGSMKDMLKAARWRLS